MKYTQLLMGLIAGMAIGGSVVASTGAAPISAGGAVDAEAVRKIVRDVIDKEPQLILASVQKFQEKEHSKSDKAGADALKSEAVRKQIFDDKGIASVGPKDSKRVIVEFFDYNCPACKMQYQEIDKIVKKDSSVRILFREYPIFGSVSEENSRLGIGVAHVAPEKYFAFYEKMHSHQGRVTENDALAYIKELGIDVEKVRTEAKKPETNALLEENRKLADILNIKGTPTLIVGDQMIPHAAEADDILSRLGSAK